MTLLSQGINILYDQDLIKFKLFRFQISNWWWNCADIFSSWDDSKIKFNPRWPCFHRTDWIISPRIEQNSQTFSQPVTGIYGDSDVGDIVLLVTLWWWLISDVGGRCIMLATFFVMFGDAYAEKKVKFSLGHRFHIAESPFPGLGC